MRRHVLAPVVIGTVCTLLAAAWFTSWTAPRSFVPKTSLDTDRLMSARQYDQVLSTHPRPYVVERAIGGGPGGGAGRVVVFGAEHTKDPGHPQLTRLREEWERLKPTVALVEGRPSGPLAALGDPVKQFGESGLVVSLARRASWDGGCEIYSWEPDREWEVRTMLAKFPKERVALFYILRPYVSDLRHGKPANPDAALEATRVKRSKWPGLEGAIDSVAAVDAIWKRDFAGLLDWRDTSDAYGWPGYLKEISEVSRDLRTANLAASALELAGRGERVFVVCGSSHAVRVELALTQ